ncbi:MAG: hypothetical protein WD877_01325 [Candidatus Saccharimonadales bacterium]
MTKNNIPPIYIGKTFREDAWDDDKNEFFSLSNEKKWEWGYWVEEQATKFNFKVGFITGISLSLIIFLLSLGLLAD